MFCLGMSGFFAIVDFLVHDLVVLYSEGVEMYAFIERQYGVTYRRVVCHPKVLLRGTRRRCRVAVPVVEYLQTLRPGIAEGCELVFRREGEML